MVTSTLYVTALYQPTEASATEKVPASTSWICSEEGWRRERERKK
jgi:hypothetical protein